MAPKKEQNAVIIGLTDLESPGQLPWTIVK
jgi:hypothetical protein